MSQMSSARGAVQLVQPIVVDASGDHWGTVQAAAAAAAAVFVANGADPVWTQWWAASVGKSVRRAKAAAFEKAAALDLPHVQVEVIGGRAIAFAPVTYEQMHPVLARMQVAGTDLPRDPAGPYRPVDADGVDLTVMVDQDGSMSTGKLAAQVAHVVVGWTATRLDFQPGRDRVDVRLGFVPSPDRFVVVPVRRELMAFAASQPEAYPVRDAGHTEVDPGTLTAVGVPTRLVEATA